MKIVWSAQAAADLEAAIEHVSAENEEAAEKLAYQRLNDTLLIVRVYHQKREPIVR